MADIAKIKRKPRSARFGAFLLCLHAGLYCISAGVVHMALTAFAMASLIIFAGLINTRRYAGNFSPKFRRKLPPFPLTLERLTAVIRLPEEQVIYETARP